MKSDKIQPLRTLIVEDDQVNFILLKKLLCKSGVPVSKIEYAQTLDGALEIAEDSEFDIIFLDLDLPDSNGLETVIKTHEKCPDTPIVVVTGAYEDNLGPRTISCGAQEYLKKGEFDAELLSQAVRYALERKENEKNLKDSEEKYRLLFEEAMDAIFVSDTKTGIIIDCNRAATKLVGREKSELIGQHQRILYPSGEEPITEEGAEFFELRSGDDKVQVIETKVVTKSGEMKDVAVKVNTFELNGEKLMQSIFRDITWLEQIGDKNRPSYQEVLNIHS